MDVRCEKCSTEYELDEARLKPGGVTVKCTNCGHTFKVRRRTPSAAGGQVPATMTGMPRGPAPATPAPPAAAASAAAAGNDRQWLIRLENGETRSCRELATLQQWILAGEVTRDALISRSGKTWKLLGDILELGTYFTIADEAKQQRSRRESAKPPGKKAVEEARQTLVGVGAVSSGAMALGDLDSIEEPGDNDPTTARRAAPRAPGRAPSATDEVVVRTTAPHAAGAEPVPATRGKTPSAGAAPAVQVAAVPSGLAATVPVTPSQPATPAVQAPAAAPAPAIAPPMPAGWPQPSPSAAAPPPPAGPAGPSAGVPVGQSSMPWTGGVAAAAPPAAAIPSGPSGPIEGPMGGRLHQTGDEPAFAGGRPRIPQASQPFTGVARGDSLAGNLSGSFAPDDDVGPAVAPRGSRAGLWIAIASLAVIAGGFAVVYFLVLKTPAKQPAADAGAVDAPVAVVDATNPAVDAVAPPKDAGAVQPQVPDAAPATGPADAGGVELASNVEGRMRAAVAALAESKDKDEAAVLAMRARLLTSIAQSLEDRASLLAPGERSAADKLRSKAKEAVNESVSLVSRALKVAPGEVSANLAMADLMRLQGKAPKDLRRYLDAARAAAPGSVDLALLDGFILLKEGKLGEARQLWTKADAGEARLEQSGDVRLRFRVAVAALADGNAVEARAAVDKVLEAQPEHEGAKALIARLDQTVANTDPLPPEENGGREPDDGGAQVSAGDSYEKLVKKADDTAEKSCAKAIPLYQAALDKTPNGIKALIGMGFCHIETKNFSSANSRFRTVLALDAKNERALWGIGQLYQEQGSKAKAIEAFKAYLEVYPNSAAAKRQLDQLGGDSGGSTPPPTPTPSGSGEGSASPPPETPPAAPPSAPPAPPAPSESAQ